ncbi:MAG TPA: glycosyltransferase family 4 protein [Thermoanaerobaculia bacterium]|nr:glycosyltransferase family 4 protein [Thermoanaerobaculia bacterium]
MRVLYATVYDPHDATEWSGLGNAIAGSLEQAGVDVDYVGPLAGRRRLVDRTAAGLARLGPGSYLAGREPGLARAFARTVEREVRRRRPDALVSPGTIPVAHVPPGVPLLIWADATFAAMVDYYPGWTGLSALSRRQGNALEKRALRRAERLVFASDWAAASAIADYGADPRKVHVVPFGSNLPIEHGPDDVRRWLEGRPRDHCRLLLVGVDWERKGVDTAIGAAVALNEAGLRTTLTVAGALPPSGLALPPCVQVKGPLPRGPALSVLYQEAHFLVLPTRSEAFGVVFSEASAFGVPSIASNTGGVPSAVVDGRNGHLLPPGASSTDYAAAILELFTDADTYRRLALATYREYDERLNWATSGAHVRKLLEEVVDGAP